MAFALSITNLLDALQQPGCPICRLFRQASQRAIESFLWENVNEPDVRQGIIASYGFCNAHTRVMVAQELYTSSIALGTNIIYEHLGRLAAQELKDLRPGADGRPSVWAQIKRFSIRCIGWLKQRIKFQSGQLDAALPLQPRGSCPACQAGNNAALNSLHVLCEEITRQSDLREKYLASDGLCLNHIRPAIQLYARRFPDAVRLLVDDSVSRLTGQSAAMKEYIRKSNWSYRDEKTTEAEGTAWRKTLTFFTGLPPASFTHQVDRDSPDSETV